MMSDAQGLRWVKAQASGAGNNCVEAALAPDGGIVVRDSKDPGGPVLRFSRSEWDAFLDGAQGGEFEFRE
jgi:hypothetical protein